MRITALTDHAKLCFAKALIANELGNQMALAYRFSDPDGVRTGKSGWSFGIVQFDISNNPNAVLCLRECGFTTDEIAGLRAQTRDDMDAMNLKLLAARDIVDKWDRKQLSECLSWPLTLCSEIGVDFNNEEAFVHIADYHNQFGMSRGGKMYMWLRGLTGPLTSEMVRDFKYTLPWGQKQIAKHDPDKDDVLRRYNNIVHIMREET